ncbi:MAG: hypothetical protein IJ249_03750 [Paludibacteraceae bacterium]|nr:hypothetical protein [Paludibacteraceae bacterium]
MIGKSVAALGAFAARRTCLAALADFAKGILFSSIDVFSTATRSKPFCGAANALATNTNAHKIEEIFFIVNSEKLIS